LLKPQIDKRNAQNTHEGSNDHPHARRLNGKYALKKIGGASSIAAVISWRFVKASQMHIGAFRTMHIAMKLDLAVERHAHLRRHVTDAQPVYIEANCIT
jgi:hypothetical protein